MYYILKETGILCCWTWMINIDINRLNRWQWKRFRVKSSSNNRTDARRDVVSSYCTISSHRPTRPARSLLFNRVFCFIIWVVWIYFRVYLHSCDRKYSRFDRFPCILECCVSFSFFSIVCVWVTCRFGS